MLREFAGWPASRATARVLEIARRAEDAGVESLWVYDHLGTFGTLRDEPTLEAFAVLGALAGATSRIRLGPLVARVGLRNPGLLVKHVATLDAFAAGRMELGLGAANPPAEAEAFGFPQPTFGERVAMLREAAAFAGAAFSQGSVAETVVNPRGADGHRIPIVIGGNSRSTWRVAVDTADEINLDGSSPDEARAAKDEIRAICRETGRDPSTLAVSVHLYPRNVRERGTARARLLAAYAATGISRVMTLVPDAETDDRALDAFIADARSAGVELAGS